MTDDPTGERERREAAQQHAGEVTDEPGRAVTPARFPSDLLDEDRELTPEEMADLRTFVGNTWDEVEATAMARAHATYSVASAEDFTRCVTEHMTKAEHSVMLSAEAFACPRCGLLLKDRKTPLASSILLERARIREMLIDAERAKPHERSERWARFRAALGL